ncbi:hypothetical protein WJX81_004796 [Elliptochloris bilobata]|uniref:Uncharacterized protein n=1 Tax=Elliptochloris bilobata TaxID=381761 RepID=A0AAW1S0Y4_9CHLO
MRSVPAAGLLYGVLRAHTAPQSVPVESASVGARGSGTGSDASAAQGPGGAQLHGRGTANRKPRSLGPSSTNDLLRELDEAGICVGADTSDDGARARAAALAAMGRERLLAELCDAAGLGGPSDSDTKAEDGRHGRSMPPACEGGSSPPSQGLHAPLPPSVASHAEPLQATFCVAGKVAITAAGLQKLAERWGPEAFSGAGAEAHVENFLRACPGFVSCGLASNKKPRWTLRAPETLRPGADVPGWPASVTGTKTDNEGRQALRAARAAQAMAAAAAPALERLGLQRRAGLLAAAAGGA